MARYALVYTIAQDKSRLDVDNNSLLRTAYTYYNNQENDSLYAKCEYYMLNDKNANKLSLLIKIMLIAYLNNYKLLNHIGFFFDFILLQQVIVLITNLDYGDY